MKDQKGVQSNLRVYQLLDQINSAHIELAELRESCSHSEGYHLGLWSWRVGSSHPSRICNTCLNEIEGITEKETIQCRVENTQVYSDGDGCGMFQDPIPLAPYLNDYVGYSYDQGICFSDPDFEKFYEKYESWKHKLSLNFMKVVKRT